MISSFINCINLIYFSLWLKAEYIKLVVMEPPIPPKTIELMDHWKKCVDIVVQ